MKKYLIIVLLAILTGTLLGYITFNRLNSINNDNTMQVGKVTNQVYAIQAGVFDSATNANELAQKYGGLVVSDNNKYRVYIAIVSNCLNTIKNYYDKKGISYYVKNIDVSNEFYNTLLDYETLLLSASEENYDEIMINILKEYEKEENDV